MNIKKVKHIFTIYHHLELRTFFFLQAKLNSFWVVGVFQAQLDGYCQTNMMETFA